MAAGSSGWFSPARGRGAITGPIRIMISSSSSKTPARSAKSFAGCIPDHGYPARHRCGHMRHAVPRRSASAAHGVHARSAARRPRSVKPEAADYLGKARHCLASAKTIAAADVPDVAAREAYLAVYIFARTGKAAKTQRGAKGQFNRPGQHKPRIGRDVLTLRSLAGVAATPRRGRLGRRRAARGMPAQALRPRVR